METRGRCGAVDQNTTMNKAAYKLKGLPPIYCINLDGEPHRWEAAENMFKEWEVENYTRVSAYDGREDDLSDILLSLIHI